MKFTDAKGREWDPAWNVGSLTNVRDAIEVNLFRIDEDAELQLRLRQDDELLVNVLFLLCEEQAKAADITDRQFGEGLDGDSLAKGEEAFWAEGVRFFRGHRRQQLLRAVEIHQNLDARAAAAIDDSLATGATGPLLDRAEKAMRDELAELMSSRSAGN